MGNTKTERPRWRWLVPGLVAMLAVAVLPMAPAAAEVDGGGGAPQPQDWPACSAPEVTQQCITSFTVDGKPPATNLSLSVFESAGSLQMQVRNSDSADGYDLTAGAAGLTTDSVVEIALNLGAIDPVTFGTTGAVESYATTASDTTGNTLTFTAQPRPSSWSYQGCSLGDCGGENTAAGVDYGAMLIASTYDVPDDAESPDDDDFREATRGAWIASDAQALSSPYSDGTAFRFDVAAPHLRSDGTPNTGFFTAFLPDSLLAYMGAGGTDVVVERTDDGTTTTVAPTVTAVDGGVKVHLEGIGYSNPSFAISAAEEVPLGPVGDGLVVFTRDVSQTLNEGTDWDLYLLDPATGSETQLTSGDGMDHSAAFSPDGQRVAFVRGTESDADVYVVGVDGTGLQALTSSPALDGSPTWSPDGSQLAFVSERGGQAAIYTMDADGSGVQQLTTPEAALADADVTPHWSPQGDLLAFARTTGEKTDIWLRDLANGSERLFLDAVTADGNARSPRISRAGDQVLYHHSSGGPNFDVFVVGTDGGGQYELTGSDAFDGFPRWSPSGLRVVFTSHRNGTDDDLYVMPAGGGMPRQLTSTETDEFMPDWQPVPGGVPVPLDACEEDSANGTYWNVAEDGHWGDPTRWSNGVPTATTHACVVVPGTYTVRLSGTRSAASLSFGASTNQTLLLKGDDDSNASLAVSADAANRGTIVLDAWDPNTGITGQLTIGGTLTNHGVVQADGAGTTQRYIRGNLVNETAGRILAARHLWLDAAGSSLINRGHISVAAGASFDIRPSGTEHRFEQQGGEITLGQADYTATGRFIQRGGVLRYTAGSVTGSSTAVAPADGLWLLDVALEFATDGSSSGAIPQTDEVRLRLQGSFNKLSGDIPVGTTLHLEGGDLNDRSTVDLIADATNRGTIVLDDWDPNAGIAAALTMQPDVVLTNAGVIRTSGIADSQRVLRGDVVNAAEGVIELERPLAVDKTGGVFRNEGTLSVAAGRSIEVRGSDSSHRFVQAGGAVVLGQADGVATGRFIQRSGAFEYRGGSIVGDVADLAAVDAPWLLDVAMTFGDAVAATDTAALRPQGSSNKLSGDIPVGTTLHLEGGDLNDRSTVDLIADATNRGTIVLDDWDPNAGIAAALTMQPDVVLTNAGVIRTSGIGNTDRVIDGTVHNVAGGLVDVDRPLLLNRAGVTHRNDGTFEVAGGKQLRITGGDLANANGQTLTGGTFALAGTLRLPGADIRTNAADLHLGATGAIVNDATGANALDQLALNSGTLVLVDRTLVVPAALRNTGTIGGAGTISGDVTNGGTIAPEGKLSITGSFTNADEGTPGVVALTLSRDGGTDALVSDIIAVGGTVDGGDGGLRLEAAPGYAGPTLADLGERVTFLEFGSIIAGMAPETYLLNPGDGVGFEPVVASATSVALEVVDVAGPVWDGGIDVSDVSDTAATITLPSVSDNVGVTGYLADGYTEGELTDPDAAFPYVEGSPLQLPLTALAAGTTYEVRVVAVDAAGNASEELSVSFTTAPAAPTALTATGGTGKVDLTWTAPEQPAPVTYQVYRRTAGGEATKISASTITATTYTDTTATAGTAYTYTVRAVTGEAHGNRSSVASNEATATATTTTTTTTPPQTGGGSTPTPPTTTTTTPPRVEVVKETVAPKATITAGAPKGEVSAEKPLSLSIMTPTGGDVAVEERETPAEAPQPGFQPVMSLQIEAPRASMEEPLGFDFEIHPSMLPPGSTLSDVVVFRDGTSAGMCLGSTVAVPDPCISNRAIVDGVLTVTVLTSHASTWDVAAAEIGRVQGADRIATAVAVSGDSYGNGAAGAVVLARSDDFADALAATPLAVAVDGPLLLTEPGALPAATAAELQRVLAAGGTVHVVGGIAAVGEDVVQSLVALGYEVRRHEGADRAATAVAIAGAIGGTGPVLLVDGWGFPDGLTAGVAAAIVDGVVLLVRDGAVPAATAAELERRGGEVFAVGGPAARAVPDATRVAGEDRYATAVAVAERFFDGPSGAGITSGLGFADALAAGPMLARSGRPLLLVAGDTVPSSTAAYVQALDGGKVHVFGGVAAVGASVSQALQS